MEFAAGAPSWIDYMSPDLEASKAFYTALFGWGTFVVPDPDAGGYGMFLLGDKQVGGFMAAQPDSPPPTWTVYFNVADADAIVATAETAGGKAVVPVMDVMDQGRMAIIADPVGAVFGIWQPKEMTGAGVWYENHAACWVENNTRDAATARAFYERLFGWQAKVHPDYTEFSLGDIHFAGQMQMGDQFPPDVPSHWLAYIQVPSADESAAKVTELGGRVLMGPMDIPDTGRIAVFADPVGAAIGVYQPA